jgi:hypothetical protein
LHGCFAAANGSVVFHGAPPIKDLDDVRMRHAPPQQPSSTVTTLRALVMLACLIGVPIIALNGTAVPGMIRQYLIERLGGTVPDAEARADLDEAPPFVPQVSVPAAAQAGFASEATRPPASYPQPPPYGSTTSAGRQQDRLPPWAAAGQAQSSPPAVPATIHQGQTGPGPDAVLANYDSSQDPRYGLTASGIQEVPRQFVRGNSIAPDVAQQTVPPEQSVAGLAQHAAQAVGQPGTIDQFLYIQRRLRDLGANYYLLENWGVQGECYRFHCRIAVANSANFTKHFEATDRAPLAAMTRVLAEVESWRRGTLAWESPSGTPGTGRLPTGPPRQASPPNGGFAR